MRVVRNFFERLQLGTALTIGFGFVLLLALLLGVGGVYRLSQGNDATQRLYERDLLGISHLKQANVEMIDIGRSLRKMALARDAERLVTERSRLDSARARLARELERGRQSIFRENVRRQLEEYDVLLAAYLRNVDRAAGLIERASPDSTAAAVQFMADAAFVSAGDAADSKLQAVTDSKAAGASESMQQNARDFERARLMSILLLFGALFGGGGLAWLTATSVRRPLEAVRASIETIASGTLNEPVPHVNFTNEVGAIATAVEVLQRGAQVTAAERLMREQLAQIDQALQSTATYSDFANVLGARLAPIMDLVYGALYIADAAQTKVERVGGYGCDDAINAKTFAFGAGLVGQAAMDHRRITLSLADKVDVGVSLGLGTIKVHSVVIAPVLDRGRVLGVLELGTMNAFGEREAAFLTELLPDLSEKLQIVAGIVATRELLAETQAQAHELAASQTQLMARKEELEGMNEQLAGQAAALEEQAEELESQKAALLEQQDALESSRQEMAQAEERTRLILGAVGDGIVGMDVHGSMTFVNPAVTALLGYSEAELIGHSMHDLVHYAHADGRAFGREECPMYLTVVDGAARTVDDEVLWRKDGTSLPVEYSTTPVFKDGEIVGSVIVFRDITERKQAQEKLRLAIFQSDQALDLAKAGYWHIPLNTDDPCYTSSERAAAIFGDPPTPGWRYDLMGHWGKNVEAGDAEAAARTFENYAAALAGTVPRYDATYAYKRPIDGRVVWIHALGHVVRDASGTPTDMYGVTMDVTEAKEAEKAVAAERARLQSILDTSPINIGFSTQGIIRFANPTFTQTFGFRVGDQAKQMYVDESARDRLIDMVKRDGIAKDQDIRMYNRDREPREMLATFMPITYDGEDGILSWIMDISDRKAAEAAIVAAKEAAEQAEATKSAFLASMSHEIRTPMNGVLSMAEMLGQTDLNDDQRSMLSVVRSSADSLLTIINDILDFSKLEAGKMTIEAIEFDAANVVEEVVQLLKGRADEKSIGLVSEVGADLPALVRGDPTRLRQIVLNLAGNAVKFTEHGDVRIGISAASPTGIRVEVTDSGIGMTPEQQSRLFQPFQQADTSTARKFGGSGLGLSICRRLVDIMGGTIGATSEIGVGSTFWFELPLPALAAPAQPETAIDDLRVLLAGFAGEQARILAAYVHAAGAQPLLLDVAGDVVPCFERDPKAADVVVLPTYPNDVQGGGLRIARSLRELPGCSSVAIGLIVPATLLSSASAAAATGFVATTTEPVRRDRFWRMLAVAVGRAKAERRAARVDSTMRYDAPSVEAAVAARAVILVAEDNKTNQVVISRLLNQLGLVFEMADNGAIALQRLQTARDRFGLLLTDFHMPEMDGFELTERWRQIEAKAGVERRLPILALTADAMAGMADRCTAIGMDGFLTKPIVRDALIAELETWLPVAFDLRTAAGSTASAAAPAAPPPVVVAPADVPVPLAEPSSAPTAKEELAPLSAEPAIDMAEFAQQLGVEPGPEAVELLLSLWESLAELPTELQHALSIKNRTELREAAHGGKGAAKALAAFPLGERCSVLQEQSETLDWDQLAGAVAGVLAEYERASAAVRTLSEGAR